MGERLKGMSAVVTGGGRGIGRGVAKTMAAEGAKVVVNDLGTSAFGHGADPGPAHEVAAEIVDAGGEAIAHAGDITDRDQAAEMVGAAIDAWGKLDILVNVAGTIRLGTILDATEEDLESLYRVHVLGYFHTAQIAARHWAARGEYGRLINFTSGAGHWQSNASALPYAAAKSAVVGLTRSCANALAAYNVTANCVSPRTGGGTPMGDAVMKGAGGTSADAAGTDRDPVNIAPMVVFLSSPAAGHISGRVFGAYGGRYSRWSEPREEVEVRLNFLAEADAVYAELEAKLGAGVSLADLPAPAQRLPEDWREQFGIRVPRLELS
jgi:NAD(P)-dependent dehydrogenase (short-subunit alcohol dehydrogenase family)